jgi:NAD(P)-dependent dehydrogenase (short-subunit alcohol dehydrogenase family)
MNISSQNKNVLITGATGNLGKKISELYIKSNVKTLILVDKSKKGLSQIQELLSPEQQIIFIQTNLLDVEVSIKKILIALKKVGTIDVLINNAAYVGASNLPGWNVDYMKQTIPSWDSAMKVNITFPNELIKAAIPFFNPSNHPNILNMGSIYGSMAPNWAIYDDTDLNNPAAYNVSKAGLIQLSKYLATYLGPKKIRVNSLSPGGIFNHQEELFVQNYTKNTPLGDMLSFDEVAEVAFLVTSEKFKNMTGQNIILDGGFSL